MEYEAPHTCPRCAGQQLTDIVREYETGGCFILVLRCMQCSHQEYISQPVTSVNGWRRGILVTTAMKQRLLQEHQVKSAV